MAGPLLRLQSKLKPTTAAFQQIAGIHNRSKIGSREVVGYGINGEYTYIDHIAFPFSAVRFKESTPEVIVSFELKSLKRIYLDALVLNRQVFMAIICCSISGFDGKAERRLEEAVN